MVRTPAQAPDSSVRANVAPFRRHLRAEGKAPSTIVTYAKAVAQLAAFLERDGYPPRSTTCAATTSRRS